MIILCYYLLLLLLPFWLETNSSWEFAPWCYMLSLWECMWVCWLWWLVVCQHFTNNFSVPTSFFAPLLLSLHASWWGSFSSCAAGITVEVLASSGITISSCISKNPLCSSISAHHHWVAQFLFSPYFSCSLYEITFADVKAGNSASACTEFQVLFNEEVLLLQQVMVI